jgi:hypothetical protein
MQRNATAIVTGYTRNPELLAKSMAPLRELKRCGVFARILYVSWDKAELDPHLAPLAAMPEIELDRVPEPKADGTPYQKGVVYQVRNLEAALERVDGDDTLVFKTRPDFVADAGFLERKIANFSIWSAPILFPPFESVGMPASPFARKLWVPWADANQPFFYEDAAFMGLKCDCAKLVTPHIEDKVSVLATKANTHGPFAHVVRFASIFREEYPIFARYLREYKYFTNDMDYRRVLVTALMKEGFFWQMLAAHAWILAQNFHVDCGTNGELRLYPNIYNANADWSNLASLKIHPPFDDVEAWRGTVNTGSLLSGVARVYGRLLDDAWQHAAFGNPTDLTRDQLADMLKRTMEYGKGGTAPGENSFYRTLSSTHKSYFQRQAAA